jgi:hypothetical protein
MAQLDRIQKLDRNIVKAYTDYLDLKHTHDDVPVETLIDLFAQKVKETLLSAYEK